MGGALVKERVELVDDMNFFLTITSQPPLFKVLVNSFVSDGLVEVMHQRLPVFLLYE